jgi:sugar lactone lactonase YvrE
MQSLCMTTKQTVAATVRPGLFEKFALLFAAPLMLAPVSGAFAQAVPVAELVQSKTLTPINGNAGHVAANNLGDSFYVSQTDNVAYWLPRGKTTPIALVTGLSGGRSVYVSANNNVYVSSNYSGRVIEVPYANGTYATNTANSSGIANCAANPTSPCLAFGNGAGATGYYLQTADLGFDQLTNGTAGPDAYVVDERDNVCNQSNAATSCNTILKFTPTTNGAYTATVVVTGLPQTNNGQIAVGPKGDVYYADGTNVYYIAAGATKYSLIGTGLVSPNGVSTDVYGNLYITDSGANNIYEMPAVNGVAQPASQFIFLNTYSANGVGFDGLGHVFYTGYSNQTQTTTLNESTLNTFNLGAAALGTPVSATASTITVQFTGPVTLGALTLSGATSGFSYVPGTCAAGTAYIAGSSCTINANYTPTSVGLQKGAVTLTNSTGGNIAVGDLSGIGLGAAQTNDPGTLTAIGSGFTSPQGIAVDGAANVYIADPGQNAVLLYPAGSSTATKIGTGLTKPTSVALDNAGNLYIADSGNGRVVEVPNIGGVLTSSAQSVIISSLGTALGIATDLNNNLYIADSTKNQVLQLGTIAGLPNAASTSQLALSSTGTSTFTAPIAVATDSTGNVFIADTTANTVTEITYYGKQTINIGTGYSHPSGLATDAAGSIYVADSGNGRLLKIPFESPIFNTNDQYTVGATVAAPYGVALDSSANLYVVDSADAQAYELNRAQGTLALGRANINTTTSQSNGYVGNAGNQALTLGNPAYVPSGNTSVFTINSPSSNGCANSSTMLPGFACILGATFSPTAIGNYSATLSFSSNAANTAAPSLMLTGVGLNQATTTTALAQTSPSGTAAFGQAVTISATISSSKLGTPSGTVTFFVDGAQQPRPSAVTNGVATITLTNLTGGSHTVGATYSGDNNYAPSAAATLGISVAKTGSSTSLATSGGFQNPASAVPGTPISLIATVTPTASTVPTGSVTFTLGSTTLGTASVSPVILTAYGASTTVYRATLIVSTLPTGVNSVTATYSGDVNYLSSSSVLPITITPMVFLMTPGSASATVTGGQTGTVSLQVISLAGYVGYVGLSCSGLPANTTCGFSPNGFGLQASNLITAALTDVNNPNGPPLIPATYGPTNVVVSFITGTTPTIPQPPVGELRVPGLRTKLPVGAVFLALAPIVFATRRRVAKHFRRSARLLSLLFLLCGGVTLFSGCGSGLIGITPTGTYHVTITATSTASGNPASLAPGCAYIPSAATTPTCTQTTQVTLVVQ